MSRDGQRVVPHPNGWAVKNFGAQRASRVFPTKAEAVAYARTRVPENAEYQTMIHKQNGQFQEERTYKNDPKRTKG